MGRKPSKKASLRWRMRDGKPYASLRWMENGKRREQALGFISEEEAEERCSDKSAELRLGVNRSSVPEEDYATVEDVVNVLLLDYENRGVQQHASTEVAPLKRHLGMLSAERVTGATLRRYIGTRQREVTYRGTPPKSGTIRHELALLRSAYRVARETGIIDCEPPAVPRVKMPDDKRPQRRLTLEEVEALIGAAYRIKGEHVGNAVGFLAWSARRPVAVFSVRRCDCERLPDQVRFPADKAGRRRGWGPVSLRAAGFARRQFELTAELPLEHPLWYTRWGNAWEQPAAFWAVHGHGIAKAAGVSDVQLYDLRRFGITEVLTATSNNLRLAMQFTGHTSPNTLLRYAYHRDEDIAAAARAVGARAVGLHEVSGGHESE